MEFDVIAYAAALDEFLVKMEQIPGEMHPGVQDALEGIAGLLRIASIKAELYENIGMEQRGVGSSADLYRKEQADERCVKQRHIIQNGNVACYFAYQISGQPDWSETEREKIGLVLKILFVFNGRARVFTLAEYMAFHDQQLGTYNLPYFMKHAGMLIGQGRITEFAACYFNLRRFSVVNDQLGRDNATEVMKRFVQQFSQMLSQDEPVCRIGGDNFVVLFAKKNLDTVMKVLKGSYVDTGMEEPKQVLISASAGIYMIDDFIESPTDIMDNVSVANNLARRGMQNSVVFYNENVAQKLVQDKMIQTMFPDAVRGEEFQVYYQPKVNLKDYSLMGAEALCRWFHEGKMITPDKFIPVLERTKAICQLDFYMLDHVCRHIRHWLDEGRQIVKVSVNLSRCHFGDANLLNHVLEIIDKNQVPHEYIEIELTETTTDVDFKDLKNIVFGLQKYGISTSVDDFGIGYSSLNLIRELPWNVLKLDKSFISEDTEDKTHSRIMLKHVIAMAQEMGMECIVEGVETMNQMQLLKNNNCYLAQGFYFDRPMPKEDFEKLLVS